MNEIQYKVLRLTDIHPNLLQNFNRYQETTRVWAMVDGNLVTKDAHFIDDWADEKKMNVIQDMRNTLDADGVVIGAYQGDDLIGFACLESSLFGSNLEYRNLSYIHVSRHLRGCGIGRKLFTLTSEQAKSKGTVKLYISTQPSIESQAFYRSMGCVLAKEINPHIFDEEPLDIQLEYVL